MLKSAAWLNESHTLGSCDRASWAKYEERKPTRCNNYMFIINFCPNMFRASLCPSSGEQRPCYCIWWVVLVLLDVVGSGCGALLCRMWALWRFLFNQKPSQLRDISQRQIRCDTKQKQLLLFDCFVSRICLLTRYAVLIHLATVLALLPTCQLTSPLIKFTVHT